MAERKKTFFGFMSRRTKEGKWEKDDEQKVVGRVSRDGHIENTDYKFTRPVVGGVAIGEGYHKKLREVDEHTLEEPLTGDKFERTRKGTGWWSPITKRFFKDYVDDGERK